MEYSKPNLFPNTSFDPSAPTTILLLWKYIFSVDIWFRPCEDQMKFFPIFFHIIPFTEMAEEIICWFLFFFLSPFDGFSRRECKQTSICRDIFFQSKLIGFHNLPCWIYCVWICEVLMGFIWVCKLWRQYLLLKLFLIRVSIAIY